MADRCPTCGQVTDYNGWPNYETWVIALWMGNDEIFDAWARDLIREALDRGASLVQAGLELRDAFLEDSCPAMFIDKDGEALLSSGSVWADLIGHATQIADWTRIAEKFAPEDTPS